MSLAVATVLVLAGAACSDDVTSARDGNTDAADGADGAAPPAEEASVTIAPPDPAAPAPAAPDPAATEPAATEPTAADVPVGGDAGNFCDRLLEASSAFDLIGLESVEGQTPEEIAADFDAALAVMGELVQSAPTDLVDPLERLRLSFETTRTYYESYGFDLDALTAALASDPALADEYVASLAAIDADGQFDAGVERLTAYQRDVCGHDVDE